MNPILLFFTVTGSMLLAEMGDKTQLLLVALTAKYKIRDIVLGTLAAEILLNLLAVGLGAAVGTALDDYLGYVKAVAALLFLWFALSSLRGESEEEESEAKTKKERSAFFAVAISFFLAELGDKTQLTAILLAANHGAEGWGAIAAVFFGCCVGLFASDMIGMAVGYLLKKKMPERPLQILSFLLFAGFGIVTVNEAARLFFAGNGKEPFYSWLVTAAVALVFAILSLFLWLRGRSVRRNEDG